METTIFEDLQLSTEICDAVQLSTFTESTYEKKGQAKITVDDEMSTTSENPVQNKVLTNNIQQSDHRILMLEKVGERIGALDVGTDLDGLIKTVTSIRDIFKGEWSLIIQTPAELLDFMKRVNNGYTFKNERVLLANNIDMDGYICPSAGFQSNGSEATKSFSGTFDGQNNRILNLTIQPENTAQRGVGFIGSLGSGGTVKNLRIENCKVIGGNRYVGCVVGHNGNDNEGIGGIENCHVKNGLVLNENKCWAVGGLIGFSGSNVKDSSFDGTIEIPNDSWYGFGGIVGHLAYNTVINCQSTGMIKLGHPDADNEGPRYAGIVGSMSFYENWYGSSNVFDCSTDMTIEVAGEKFDVTPIIGSITIRNSDPIDGVLNAIINSLNTNNTWTDNACASDTINVYTQINDVTEKTEMTIHKGAPAYKGIQTCPASSLDNEVVVSSYSKTSLDNQYVRFDSAVADVTVSITGSGFNKLHNKAYWESDETKTTNMAAKDADIHVIDDNNAQITLHNTNAKYGDIFRPGNKLTTRTQTELFHDKDVIRFFINAAVFGQLTDSNVTVTPVTGKKVTVSVSYPGYAKPATLTENKDYTITYPVEGNCIITGIDLFYGTVEKTFTPIA